MSKFRIEICSLSPEVDRTVVNFRQPHRSIGLDEVTLRIFGDALPAWYLLIQATATPKSQPQIIYFGPSDAEKVCVIYGETCVAGRIDSRDSFFQLHLGGVVAANATRSNHSILLIGRNSIAAVWKDLSYTEVAHEFGYMGELRNNANDEFAFRAEKYGQDVDVICCLAENDRRLSLSEIE